MTVLIPMIQTRTRNVRYEDDDDMPQVWERWKSNMAEEGEEFLEFSRHALGITDEHWREIVRDRMSRGGELNTDLSG
jgi:hypothetical protein